MPELTKAQADLAALHHHLAQHAALHAKRRWPMTSRDDLLSDAYLGLCEAAQRYDPASTASFPTFAHPRIWGAMIDGYRHRTGWNWRTGEGGHKAHYGYPTNDDGEILEPIFRVDDLDLEQVLDRIDAHAQAAGFDLNGRDLAILVEVGGGRTMLDVGVEFGVSESRVCQIRAAARRKLANKQAA